MSSAIQNLVTEIVTIASLSDIFNTDPTTPAVNLGKYGHAALSLQLLTSGGTGQARIEAYCCDDAAKNNPVEIDYSFRTATTGDSFGPVQKAEAGQSSRLLTTVGATLNDQYICEIRDRQCKENKPFVFFKMVEVVNDPVVGRAFMIASEPKTAGATLPSALS